MKAKLFFVIFLFILTPLCLATSIWAVDSSDLYADKSSFTLEVKGDLINLQAQQASFKDILRDLEKKIDINVKIFDGVKDKKVSLNIEYLPVFAIHSLLEKMELSNFAVVYDSDLSSDVIYVLAEGQDINEVIKGKSIIRTARFANGENINQIKGHEIETITKGRNKIPIRYIKDEVIIKFHLGVTEKEIDDLLKKHNIVLVDDNSLSKIGYIKARIPDGRDVVEVIKEIRQEYKVKFPEPNYIAGILTVNDPLYENQWYVPDTNFDKAWGELKNKSEVRIAVIDTGVTGEHPDLKGKILEGYDFINNDADAMDDNGHGTFVSGIIAATSNDIGIKGLYDYAKILPIKVIDASGLGTYEDAAKGIIYAADNGAKVINLSIGGYGYSFMLQDAVDYALENGCVVVAAGGNDGIEQAIYPAAYPDVIGVSALVSNGEIWSNSNSGGHIDVSAPGANIFSTGIDDDYVYATGTSASASIVSALAGVLVSERKDLSSSFIEKLIMQSTSDLGDKGRDKVYGNGKTNAFAALEQKIKPFHDVAVRSVTFEPTVFEMGKPTYIIAEIENRGSYKSENFDAILYQIIGEEQREVGRMTGINVVSEIQLIFEWKPERIDSNINFKVIIYSDTDEEKYNNSKETYSMKLDKSDGLFILHAVQKPVHQWIALQAASIWSNSEINSYIDNYPNSVWTNNDDPYIDTNSYNSTGGVSGGPEGILVGAGEEDKDLITFPEDSCTYQWLGEALGAPYCTHFWQPDDPQSGNYNHGYDDLSYIIGLPISNYVRAEKLWSKSITLYNNGNKNEAYYWLGRVSHLIVDISVPAHVHLDSHTGLVDGDDAFEDFMKLSDYSGWSHAGPNYQYFSGSNYIGQQYNYESVYFPSGVKTNPTNLFKLFWYVAQKTQYFASDDWDAIDDDSFSSNYNNYFRYENTPSNTIYYFSGGPSNTSLWNSEGGASVIVNDKDDIEDNTGFPWYNDLDFGSNLAKIANANIPHAMKAVAGLYRLFWNETHGTLSVTTTPVSGAIYVDGAYKGTGSWSGSVVPGSYTVSFGSVSGYITPSSQTVLITAGQTTNATGTYIVQGGTQLTHLTVVDSNTDDEGILSQYTLPPSQTTFNNQQRVYANIVFENNKSYDVTYWIRTRWYEPDGSMDFMSEAQSGSLQAGGWWTTWWFDYIWSGPQPPGQYRVRIQIEEFASGYPATGWQDAADMYFTVLDMSPVVSNASASDMTPNAGDLIHITAQVSSAAQYTGSWNIITSPPIVDINDYQAQTRTHTFDYIVPSTPGQPVTLQFTASNSQGSDSDSVTINIENQWCLTTSAGVGGTVQPSGQTCQHNNGTSVSITATPQAGYNYVNWTGTCNFADSSSASTSVTMTSDCSAAANFSLIPYTLTTSSTTGGLVTNPGEGSFSPFYYNDIVSIEAQADNGYNFVNWTGTCSVANPNSAVTTLTVTNDCSVTANFIVVVSETNCTDNIDNDSDGDVDCADQDCDGISGCEHGTELSCFDGFDNDADSLTDCTDPDCAVVSNSSVFDQFEDGSIDTTQWVVGGRTFDAFGGGAWNYENFEIVDAADGYLYNHVWGPASSLTYGAESWLRTNYDFNDGKYHTINFTWEPNFAVTDYHTNTFYIQVTDGYLITPTDQNLFWQQSDYAGTSDLLWDTNSTWKGWVFENETAPGKLNWSITINPLGVARLYDAFDASGQLIREEPLDLTYSWYLRFMVSDGTSSGFPAGDAWLTLYEFSAFNICDTDNDGILDDGDGNGISGDNQCIGGNTATCDDNCIDLPNSTQDDYDNDGVGDICDMCPYVYPDNPPIITNVDKTCVSELGQSDLTVNANDPCGGNLSYLWTPLNGGVILGSGANVQFDPPDSGPHPCPYQVELTATSDLSGLETTQIIDVYIKNAGDANGDGIVDIWDKLIVRQHNGEIEGDPNWDPRADVTCDGYVDIWDKLKVRQQNGQTGGCVCQ